MFEHSLYEPELVAEPLQEGELFYQYELRNWDIGPRVYKILGISAAANLLVFLVIATTPILTMKGCDSPFVGSVCQVLDTLYVGSTLAGTDRDYVDAVYDKTKIGATDDVTFVDVTGDTPPLSYPEGYFAIANPEEFAALQASAADPNAISGGTTPGLPPGLAITSPSEGNALFNTAPKLPRANPHPVTGDLPSGFGSGSTVATNTGKKGSGKKGEDDLKPAQSPSPTPAQYITSDSVNAVQINRLPLTDLANMVNQNLQNKTVDLSKNFSVTLYAVIDKDGLLDPVKSKFDDSPSKKLGDPAMIDTAKAAMEALGRTGFLQYLVRLGIDKATIMITQDDNNITAVIASQAKTPEHAKQLASGMNGILTIGKVTAKNPSDERTLLDGATSTTDGKNTFLLNFAIPKPMAQDMIKKVLQEQQAKQQASPQGTSDALQRPSNNTAQR